VEEGGESSGEQGWGMPRMHNARGVGNCDDLASDRGETTWRLATYSKRTRVCVGEFLGVGAQLSGVDRRDVCLVSERGKES
jgi:hypothetical protein